MIRTVFRLEPEEKDWLRRCARSEHLPMAEVLRRALRHYRVRRETPEPSPSQLPLWDDPALWDEATPSPEEPGGP